MGINICELTGGHHFFIHDNPGTKALEEARGLAGGLYKNKDPDREELTRSKIADSLSMLIGFRKAEEIAQSDIEDIFPVIDDISARRIEEDQRNNHFFNAALDVAERNYTGECEGTMISQNVNRDAVYHALQRSGLGEINNIVGGGGGLYITDCLLEGRQLAEIIDPNLFEVVEILPEAVLYADQRKRMEDILLSRGMNQEQISKVIKHMPEIDQDVGEALNKLSGVLDAENDRLVREFEKFLSSKGIFKHRLDRFAGNLGLSEAKRNVTEEILYKSLRGVSNVANISRAMRSLNEGNTSVDWVLSTIHSSEYFKRWYPLAESISEIYESSTTGPYFHTKESRCAANIIAYVLGLNGIHSSVLLHLEDMTDSEVEVTRWDKMRSRSILYPDRIISPDKLGRLYGVFDLGHGSKNRAGKKHRLTYYHPTKTEVSLFDVLESVGTLRDRPVPNKIDVGKQTTAIGFSIPFQYLDIITQFPSSYYKNDQFSRAALGSWIDEMGMIAGEGRHTAEIRTSKEEYLKTMADTIGLSLTRLSDPYVRHGVEFSKYQIHNPEILGI